MCLWAMVGSDDIYVQLPKLIVSVAKPLVADGSAKSHDELSLAYDQYSLQKLEPPLVLQEFVINGGVLFKVYVVGEAIKMVRRFSLPDVTKRELSKNVGVFGFHGFLVLQHLQMMQIWTLVWLHLADKLTCAAIVCEKIAGYEKMPGYEHIFTDFLLSLVQSRYKKRSCY
ncbi:hypothetical protein CRYUN_Cryun30bG0047300 [Craigia yunnanensis]